MRTKTPEFQYKKCKTLTDALSHF